MQRGELVAYSRFAGANCRGVQAGGGRVERRQFVRSQLRCRTTNMTPQRAGAKRLEKGGDLLTENMLRMPFGRITVSLLERGDIFT